MTNIEDVTGSEHALRAILEELTGQHQFQLPLGFLIAGADGGIQFGAIQDQSLPPEEIVRSLPHNGIAMPAHWILIDATGRPAHYLLRASLEGNSTDGTIIITPAAFADLHDVHSESSARSFSEIGDQFREVLMSLIYDHMFQWPIYLIAIGANHSLIAMRFEMDERNVNAVPHPVAQHVVGGGLATPVTFFWLDSGPDAKVACIAAGPAHLTAYLQ